MNARLQRQPLEIRRAKTSCFGYSIIPLQQRLENRKHSAFSQRHFFSIKRKLQWRIEVRAKQAAGRTSIPDSETLKKNKLTVSILATQKRWIRISSAGNGNHGLISDLRALQWKNSLCVRNRASKSTRAETNHAPRGEQTKNPLGFQPRGFLS